MKIPVSPKRTALLAAARDRILVLDGAMGTMIQGLQFDEAAFRGERFKDFQRDVRGNNDLLILTQPKAIEDIHAEYLRAGADIVATNTFSSTSIAQADYDMAELAYELNRDGARLAHATAGVAYAHVLSHPDCTVGPGVSPDQSTCVESRALPPVGSFTPPREHHPYRLPGRIRCQAPHDGIPRRRPAARAGHAWRAS